MKVQAFAAAATLLLSLPRSNGFSSPHVRVASMQRTAAPAPSMNVKTTSSISLGRINAEPKLQMSSSTATEMSTVSTEEPEKGLGSKIFDAYVKIMGVATTLFPVWTVICSGVALKNPAAFEWFDTRFFTAGLAALMLSMGITLTPADFAKVAKRPNAVVMQFSLCYLMMPLLALGLGRAFALDPALMAGMVLVGSINGGQASNLCTYIAKGNVALSVLMTTATTLGAIFMTPFLCKGLLGAVVPVDAVGIAVSTIQVVLAPIALGMSLNKFFPKFVKAILPFAPVVGVVSTCLLVASAVAQVAEPIMNAGWGLQLPVLALHLVGGLVGYMLPRLTGFGEVACRTMAIETSMKSSAFGFLLAKLHFGEYAARVPSAVSVVWMALTGSILAVIWRYIPVTPPETFDRSLVDKYPPFSFNKFWKKITFQGKD